MSFDLLSRLGGPDEASAPTCSRAGCTAGATHRVEWRNPRIHGPERIKTWLACDEHLDYLRGFVADRSFPVRVRALADPVDEEPLA